ncbi:MAG: hypothetical protein IK104_03270 [Clostridia bacterium]|nr:hypothetical protein [Clostridia bacterium]
MKKVFAVLLAMTLILTLSAPAFAEGDEKNAVEAAIIVPGVVESVLMTDPEAGAAGWHFASVTETLSAEMTNLFAGVIKATFLSDYDTLTEAALRLEDAAIGNLEMNPDGTSAYELYTAVSGAEESSYAAMLKSGKWPNVWYGAQIVPDLAAEIGSENVFVFTYDWRLGSPTITEKFASFVDEVKALVGCDRVNVYCDSYGCQVVASYLYTYGGGDDIARIVFDSPAWTGTKLFPSLMADTKEDLHFNIVEGARVLLEFMLVETDFSPLLRLLPDRVVQHVAFAMVKHAWEEYLHYAPGLWCCCAADDYEEMKAKLLDPNENAALIAEVDKAQYGVMRHIPEVLAEAEEAGIKLSVIMNEGTILFAGDNINGDGVVDAASGSGGECLPYGETFADGRTGRHVSPANDYDLTNAYLPDNTWAFYGQTHGQSYWDEEAKALVMSLLLTDEIENVNSDPRFPQFADSHCPAYDVSLRLVDRGGSELKLGEGEVQAVIRNDSEKHRVKLTGVTLDGVAYTVSEVEGTLRPGETKAVTLTPDKGAAPGYGTVTISYTEMGLLSRSKTRVQYFKVSK